MAKETDSIHSIDRALEILLLMQQEGRELGVTQIADHLSMYKSTVHRTLATLEQRGFVQQNPENGRYWLGIRLYSLGMLIREKLPLRQIAFPFAKALSEKFNEVVHIGVLDKNADTYPKQIIIDKIDSRQVLSMTPPVGSISPCHCSAVGKALLAFAPKDYIERFSGAALPSFTANTLVDWDTLMRELDKIRKLGFSLDDEELELGLTCIGAPILSHGHDIVAALSLSGPSARVRSGNFDQIVKEVKQTAMLISNRFQ